MIRDPQTPYREHIEDREFSIDTPIGSIKSDSGNHYQDVFSVVGVIIVLYLGKILIKEIIKKIR
tara:strand:+ start:439 stop:630 length:192 start_codon:yes stop_codon:yes gene_type:complete